MDKIYRRGGRVGEGSLTEARSHKGKSSFRDPQSEIGQNEQNRVTTRKTAEGKPKG
jgi:hypothetical protein